jgi:hypothetical protein
MCAKSSKQFFLLFFNFVFVLGYSDFYPFKLISLCAFISSECDVSESGEGSDDTTKKPGKETHSDPTVDARHYAALNKE